MEGMAANPSSRHYFNKDIFVYISAFEENNKPDTASYRNVEMKVGDTVFYSNGMMILKNVLVNPAGMQHKVEADEQALFLDISLLSKEGKQFSMKPGIALKGNNGRLVPDTVPQQNMVVRFNKLVDAKSGKMEIGIKESSAVSNLITLKVYEFPWINILWVGIIIMTTGFIMAIRHRLYKASLTTV
jgi:cytochrome c-type biogenesis protein CcmF